MRPRTSWRRANSPSSTHCPDAALTIEAADAGVDGMVVQISAIAAAEPAPRRYRLIATTPGEARLEGPF